MLLKKVLALICKYFFCIFTIMKYLLILLLFIGCGTRKVETNKIDLKHNSTLVEQNKISIDSVVTNILRRFVIESRKTADSVVVSDSRITYYNVIHEDKITDSTEVDIQQQTTLIENDTDKVESVVLNKKDKTVDRSTYWGLVIFFILIFFYLIKQKR